MLYQIGTWEIWGPGQHCELFVMFLNDFLKRSRELLKEATASREYHPLEVLYLVCNSFWVDAMSQSNILMYAMTHFFVSRTHYILVPSLPEVNVTPPST